MILDFEIKLKSPKKKKRSKTKKKNLINPVDFVSIYDNAVLALIIRQIVPPKRCLR